MLERAVSIDGVTYRQHEVIEIRHTNNSETFARVHSTAGAAAVNTEHQLAYNIRLSFAKAEEAIAELEFFAEVEDPYAAIVEEQAQLVDTIAGMLTDEQALQVPSAYPEWQPDVSYADGDRRTHNGVLYRCTQNHTSQDGYEPENAASLWSRILSGQSGEVGIWERPDSTNPYNAGAMVHFPTIDDPIYRSKYDNNVHSPAEWPDGWELVEEGE